MNPFSWIADGWNAAVRRSARNAGDKGRAPARKGAGRRSGASQRSELYAAAKTYRLTGDWMPADTDPTDVVLASLPAVRRRVRQLVRDFPYFSRAVNVLSAFVVGDGVKFQSRIRARSGELNPNVNRETEELFLRWAESASWDGRQHFYELQDLAERQHHEAGEYLFITHTVPGRVVPLALQPVEPDQLYSGAKPSAKNREVSGGVEYDAKTLRPVFYHLQESGYRLKTYRVPADRVVHGFDILRPGQMRGISPFAPGVLLAHELSEYMGAEIDGAKMAAKWLAFVTRQDPMGVSDFSGNSLSETGDPIDHLENGILEYLRPGESIELAKNPRPGNTFEPFVRLILSMFSVATGAPYELIAGDYSGMNYTTIRAARNDFQQFLRQKHAHHIRNFAAPVGRKFAEAAHLSGRINYPGFASDPWPFFRHEWQAPGMAPVDPLKESNAARNDMGAGLRSPQEIARARGRDLEDVYAEIQAAKEMAGEMGLAFEVGSTAAQTNPAALMEDDENE